MVRKNSGNDFSFLARAQTQQSAKSRIDTAPEYNAIARFLEEPMDYEHQRMEGEQVASFADLVNPPFLLDPSQQHQEQTQECWRKPEMDVILTGVGSWAEEAPTRNESTQYGSR